MDARSLAAVPLFSMLDQTRLHRLARQCPPREFPLGATVARAGAQARHLVIVERGSLAAAYDTSSGSRVRFETVTGPCAIDKAAVLDGGTHTATWTGLVHCRIRLLPAHLFRGLIDEVPALRDHVLRHLSAQVHRDRRARVRAGGRDPVARVADWLTEAGRTQGSRIRLPGAQQGLGEELGLSRVTVNRALRVLAVGGAIRVEPGVIVVLDTGRLTVAATGTGV